MKNLLILALIIGLISCVWKISTNEKGPDQIENQEATTTKIIKGQVTKNLSGLNRNIVVISDSINKVDYHVFVGKAKLPKIGTTVSYEVSEYNVLIYNDTKIKIYRLLNSIDLEYK
jgi:hypothetical protein